LRHHSHVDLYSRTQNHDGARRSMRYDLADLGIMNETLHNGRSLLTGHENIKVPDGFAFPAKASRDNHPFNTFNFFKIRNELAHNIFGLGPLHAFGSALP